MPLASWWMEKTDMTTFDDREKAFEKKFAHDQELRFKAEARRNRMIAEWAATKLGLTGTEVEDYVKAVRRADLAEKGDDDVFRKIRKDFDEKGVTVSDTEIRTLMAEFLVKIFPIVSFIYWVGLEPKSGLVPRRQCVSPGGRTSSTAAPSSSPLPCATSIRNRVRAWLAIGMARWRLRAASLSISRSFRTWRA